MASHDSDAFMESTDEEDDDAANDYSDSSKSSDDDDEQEQMRSDGGGCERLHHESSEKSIGVSLPLESAHSTSDDSKMATQPWQIGDHVPAAFGFDASQYQQLQLLPDRDDVKVVERNALVYWPESASWFAGKITTTDDIRGVHIKYEDGDDRWEAVIYKTESFIPLSLMRLLILMHPRCPMQKSTLRNILVLSTLPHSNPPAPEKSVEVERVVVPRPYQPILADHFQPERVARPCVCVTHTTESIVTARPNYSERKYLHVNLECTATPSTKWRATAGEDVIAASTTTRDCLVQTAADLPRRLHE